MILLDLDPRIVQPGWTPLFIILALAVVVALLFVSMRRQFRKIQVPPSQHAESGGGPGGQSPPSPT
jgi:hypothetical protein